jgi:outer membrane protein OmpA-like peptidoglycan-associated protein
MSTQTMMKTIFLFILVAFFVTTTQGTGQTLGTVVTVTGFMLDHHTLEPVEANYSVLDGSGNKIGQSRKASAKDGYLVTGLKPGATYTIRIEDPRYFKQEFRIGLPQSEKYAEVSRDFVVRKMEAGKKLMLMPPPFNLHKTSIKTGTEEDLQEIARILQINPGVKIEIVCYPDEALPAAKAEQVSAERGGSLKAFLETQGISGSRVTVHAAKTIDPLNPPPLKKGAKGKRYIGSVYLKITGV